MTDQNTAPPSEEPHIEYLRREIEQQYADHPTGCGGSFGELLCYEIHSGKLTFVDLAAKWGLSVSMIGKLVADHCDRMEQGPKVKHDVQGAPQPSPCCVAAVWCQTEPGRIHRCSLHPSASAPPNRITDITAGEAAGLPGPTWEGEICKRCKRRNCVDYNVPDAAWVAVSRGRWNVLCTTCFDEEAQAAGVAYRFGQAAVVSWSDWLSEGPLPAIVANVHFERDLLAGPACGAPQACESTNRWELVTCVECLKLRPAPLPAGVAGENSDREGGDATVKRSLHAPSCMCPACDVTGSVPREGLDIPPTTPSGSPAEASCNEACPDPVGHNHRPHDDSPAMRAAKRIGAAAVTYYFLWKNQEDRLSAYASEAIASEHAPLYAEVERCRSSHYGPMGQPWREWHQCKPPLGNPTREEAMQQLAASQAEVEQLKRDKMEWVDAATEARDKLTEARNTNEGLRDTIEHYRRRTVDRDRLIAALTSESTTQREQIASLHVALAAANTEVETARAELGRAREEGERLVAAIRDIDAHATPYGVSEDGSEQGASACYMVTVGAMHRALGAAEGRATAAPCQSCSPRTVPPEVRERIAIEAACHVHGRTGVDSRSWWDRCSEDFRQAWLVTADRILAILGGEVEERTIKAGDRVFVRGMEATAVPSPSPCRSCGAQGDWCLLSAGLCCEKCDHGTERAVKSPTEASPERQRCADFNSNYPDSMCDCKCHIGAAICSPIESAPVQVGECPCCPDACRDPHTFRRFLGVNSDRATDQTCGVHIWCLREYRDRAVQRLAVASAEWAKERDDLRALIHPWYGPCDGIANGACSECLRLRDLMSGDDRLIQLRSELAAERKKVDWLRYGLNEIGVRCRCNETNPDRLIPCDHAVVRKTLAGLENGAYAQHTTQEGSGS